MSTILLYMPANLGCIHSITSVSTNWDKGIELDKNAIKIKDRALFGVLI